MRELRLPPRASARPRTIEIPTDTQASGVALDAGTWRVALSPKGDVITLTRGRGSIVRSFECESKSVEGRYSTNLLYEKKGADGRTQLTRILLADELIEVTLLAPLSSTQSVLAVPMASTKNPTKL